MNELFISGNEKCSPKEWADCMYMYYTASFLLGVGHICFRVRCCTAAEAVEDGEEVGSLAPLELARLRRRLGVTVRVAGGEEADSEDGGEEEAAGLCGGGDVLRRLEPFGSAEAESEGGGVGESAEEGEGERLRLAEAEDEEAEV